MPLKLNEFVAGLTEDGLLVLCLSDGEITDYLVTSTTLHTLIRREGNTLSARALTADERIININSLQEVLKVLKP